LVGAEFVRGEMGKQTPLSLSDSGENGEICEIWDDRYDRRRS
jgi:hypothetical protein